MTLTTRGTVVLCAAPGLVLAVAALAGLTGPHTADKPSAPVSRPYTSPQ